MLTVFVEYRIDPAHRQAYLAYMAGMERRVAERGGINWRMYEGMDQPHLFVEMFETATEAAYREIKAWRTNDERLHAWVAGGRERIHVWAFCPVTAD